jgi:hypothetical protein
MNNPGLGATPSIRNTLYVQQAKHRLSNEQGYGISACLSSNNTGITTIK